MKNAVIYARYSSDRQREQSIEDQVKDCRKYAENNNYNIINVYTDYAKTGRNDNRAGFQRMLKDSDQQTFEVVIVWKLDRFGRNREEMAFNRHRLKKNGVKVVSAMEYISDDPVGALTESLLEGMAEFYSLSLAENIKRGLKGNAEKAKCNGPLPIGFKHENGQIVEDKEASGAIKLIFDLIYNGRNITEVLNYLEEKGIRRKNGKPFKRCTIDAIIPNERYTGTYIYGDTVIPNAIPQIIDPVVFYRVNDMVMSKGFRKSGKFNPYLFKGKLICGECGNRYTADTGTSRNGTVHYYYKCAGRKNKTSPNCASPTLRKDEFEDKVLKAIFDNVLRDEIIDSLSEKIMEKFDESPNELTAELQKQRKEVERKIENLVEAISNGAKSEVLFKELEKNEERLSQLKVNIEVEEAKNPTPSLEAIRWALRNFEVNYINSEHDKLNLVNNLLDSIIVKNNVVTINMNYAFVNKNGKIVRGPKCSVNSEMVDYIPKVLNRATLNDDFTISYSFLLDKNKTASGGPQLKHS